MFLPIRFYNDVTVNVHGNDRESLPAIIDVPGKQDVNDNLPKIFTRESKRIGKNVNPLSLYILFFVTIHNQIFSFFCIILRYSPDPGAEGITDGR